MPTEAKELDLMGFGNADSCHKSDLLISLCQQKLKVGSFSLISRQSQILVPYLIASNSSRIVALYSKEGRNIS